jgi:multiple sugar transport system permease protein
MKSKRTSLALMITIYVSFAILTVLSIFPFWLMIVNSTRSTYEIQQHAISLVPSNFLMNNLAILTGKSFNPILGFTNSLIVSVGTTVCALYFSTMTAYGVVVYDWKYRRQFFSFILAVMMIPAQITMIGFYQMVYSVGLTNNFLMLILPAVASPTIVFFMRQYMIPSLSLEIIQSARIDGAKELYIFNRIAMPIMKPALATQAIFCFVTSWNNLFTPLILLTNQDKYTMPIMVSLLNGDIYKTEYGSVYLGLTLTVLPLIIVYLFLSKFIIAGVALGSVKG